jgi:hypothetical protein
MKDSRIIVMHFQVVDAEGWSDRDKVLPHILFKADDCPFDEDDYGKATEAPEAPCPFE